MRRYRNLSGDSGVAAYETAATSITIRFVDGATYLYTYRIPGVQAVEEMKRYARRGTGLATYINRYVRKAYDHKLG